MNKPVQYFNDEYLQQTRNATPEQILQFLEQYRLMQAANVADKHKPKSKLISMKVNEDMLIAFRSKCELQGIKYQTQIKSLMQKWLDE